MLALEFNAARGNERETLCAAASVGDGAAAIGDGAAATPRQLGTWHLTVRFSGRMRRVLGSLVQYIAGVMCARYQVAKRQVATGLVKIPRRYEEGREENKGL